MRSRSTQYYKILFDVNADNGGAIQFHTGRDRNLVSLGESFNHGIRLTSELSQKDHEKLIGEILEDWHVQIKLYDLIPA